MKSRDMLMPAGGAGAIRVSGAIDDSYAAWKQADAAARALERQLKDTWRRFERGVGSCPSSGLLREAAALRHAAREKLGDVVGMLQEARRP